MRPPPPVRRECRLNLPHSRPAASSQTTVTSSKAAAARALSSHPATPCAHWGPVCPESHAIACSSILLASCWGSDAYGVSISRGIRRLYDRLSAQRKFWPKERGPAGIARTEPDRAPLVIDRERREGQRERCIGGAGGFREHSPAAPRRRPPPWCPTRGRPGRTYGRRARTLSTRTCLTQATSRHPSRRSTCR